MDGQNGYQIPLELMLMSFGGTQPQDDPNHHQFIASDAGGQENQAITLSLPHLFESQRTPLNYYEFLTDHNSSKPPAHHHHHVLDTIPSPFADSHNFIQPQTEFFCNYPGMQCASSSNSKPSDSSLDLDSWKLNLHPYFFTTHNHESSLLNVRYTEEDPVNKLENTQDQSQTQSHILWTQEPTEVVAANVSQSHPKAKVTPSVFLPKPGSNASRQRAASSDRQRRERIAERVKALQELLPHSVEGSQIAVMNEIINYVKSLQVQMKELSRTRLGGDLCTGPSIFLEGSHQYILHEQTMNEPLEETMSKLLKVNSSAATKFLESKGLLVMPMALADWLKQAI